MKLRVLMMTMTTSLVLAACGGGGQEAAQAEAEARAAKAARLQYEGEILAWRDERLARLQRPDGWLSLVGMHWLAPGATYVGSAQDNGTRLAVGPAQLGMLSLGKDGLATLKLHPGVETEVTIDGQVPEAEALVTLVPDTRGTATVVAFNKGDASFILIERAGRYGLRVRNAFARTRTAFPGLDYFDINPDMRIVARFEAHPPGQTVEIVNVLGMIEKFANPGTLSFEKDGKSFRMEAVDEGDGRLFFTFADRTSGHETYAASRMVYADPAGSDGTTVLDFNKAYNPPCAFTPFSTCPMPLPENRLDLRVEAGEKKPRPFPE
ncbi:DUF1684 domain-containing protein [Arenimonas daejeonensis]|uniref:DUF1684 domain-containing protein n=1 Tax=Arenimonas daejeonensis TaxID=370777 RepID=UPI001D159FDC|nr:DUF1684 domain-containing protein [Arenimonas daejeonensis]